MVHRWSLAIGAAALLISGLLTSGCGADRIKITPPSEAPSASAAKPVPGESSTPDAPGGGDAPPPLERLDAQSCLDVTSANLDLAVSSTTEEARAAADVFAQYNPPADVTEAIEHFVGTGGVQYDDPEFDEFNARIDNWIKEVCPL